MNQELLDKKQTLKNKALFMGFAITAFIMIMTPYLIYGPIIYAVLVNTLCALLTFIFLRKNSTFKTKVVLITLLSLAHLLVVPHIIGLFQVSKSFYNALFDFEDFIYNLINTLPYFLLILYIVKGYNNRFEKNIFPLFFILKGILYLDYFIEFIVDLFMTDAIHHLFKPYAWDIGNSVDNFCYFMSFLMRLFLGPAYIFSTISIYNGFKTRIILKTAIISEAAYFFICFCRHYYLFYRIEGLPYLLECLGWLCFCVVLLLLLFGKNKIYVMLPLRAKKTAPEEELLLAKLKFERGELTEEEYNKQRQEIINKL